MTLHRAVSRVLDVLKAESGDRRVVFAVLVGVDEVQCLADARFVTAVGDGMITAMSTVLKPLLQTRFDDAVVCCGVAGTAVRAVRELSPSGSAASTELVHMLRLPLLESMTGWEEVAVLNDSELPDSSLLAVHLGLICEFPRFVECYGSGLPNYQEDGLRFGMEMVWEYITDRFTVLKSTSVIADGVLVQLAALAYLRIPVAREARCPTLGGPQSKFTYEQLVELGIVSMVPEPISPESTGLVLLEMPFLYMLKCAMLTNLDVVDSTDGATVRASLKAIMDLMTSPVQSPKGEQWEVFIAHAMALRLNFAYLLRTSHRFLMKDLFRGATFVGVNADSEVRVSRLVSVRRSGLSFSVDAKVLTSADVGTRLGACDPGTIWLNKECGEAVDVRLSVGRYVFEIQAKDHADNFTAAEAQSLLVSAALHCPPHPEREVIPVLMSRSSEVVAGVASEALPRAIVVDVCSVKEFCGGLCRLPLAQRRVSINDPSVSQTMLRNRIIGSSRVPAGKVSRFTANKTYIAATIVFLRNKYGLHFRDLEDLKRRLACTNVCIEEVVSISPSHADAKKRVWVNGLGFDSRVVFSAADAARGTPKK